MPGPVPSNALHVTLPSGACLPALGMGTWRMGEVVHGSGQVILT